MKSLKSVFAVLLLCMCLLFSSCSMPAFSIERLDNPKETIIDFIDCLREERFDDYGKYIANYSSLGFENRPQGKSDALTEYIYDNIFKSLSVSFEDDSLESVDTGSSGADYSINGRSAEVTFTLTALDAEKLQRSLAKEAMEIAQPKINTGYTYDTEEKAYELISDSIDSLKKTPVKEFYSENTLTVSLTYIDGMWRINMNEEFFNVLSGKPIGSPIADRLTSGLVYAKPTTEEGSDDE